MSDRKYIILRRQTIGEAPASSNGSPIYVECGVFDGGWPKAALGKALESREEVHRPVEGEYLVIEADYGMERMVVSARVEYDVEPLVREVA